MLHTPESSVRHRLRKGSDLMGKTAFCLQKCLKIFPLPLCTFSRKIFSGGKNSDQHTLGANKSSKEDAMTLKPVKNHALPTVPLSSKERFKGEFYQENQIRSLVITIQLSKFQCFDKFDNLNL